MGLIRGAVRTHITSPLLNMEMMNHNSSNQQLKAKTLPRSSSFDFGVGTWHAF